MQEFDDSEISHRTLTADHYEVSQDEYNAICDLKIKKACVWIFYLAPKILRPLNHFGVMVELENGARYVIHNSPNNVSKRGSHEIVVKDDTLCHKWEKMLDWHDVQQHVSIKDLILPLEYKILTTNCIHTVRRIWKQLIPTNLSLNLRKVWMLSPMRMKTLQIEKCHETSQGTIQYSQNIRFFNRTRIFYSLGIAGFGLAVGILAKPEAFHIRKKQQPKYQ
ncbi:UNKNOWN [Stylonychia lemnae]|uniref:LRAT domain-containing protein n=1 Tax=Stylonychia lemnae TaxID=5949 RepID=A0A078B076_STYLE|nr:UNKNOWN [Stylonychia lemnae]|eukprot:CDW86483.1 UNKNOWN [Stylonychia lemnae]